MADKTPSPARRPRVMGILNVTPDSFSDGGHFATFEAAVEQALRMAAEGADIIDIGGESTRPGYAKVDAATELSRVEPVLAEILPRLDVPVSIDTTKAEVASRAIALGCRIVNDVWALRRDPDLAGVVADAGVNLVMMHNRETIDPAIDMLDDVRRYFEGSLEIARRAGIDEARITLDPGVGFGKTVEQNFLMIRRLDALKAMGFPVLVGVSRKSSLGHVTGRPVDERLAATIAANVLGLAAGADIIRVHDVAEHVDAVKIFEATRHA